MLLSLPGFKSWHTGDEGQHRLVSREEDSFVAGKGLKFGGSGRLSKLVIVTERRFRKVDFLV